MEPNEAVRAGRRALEHIPGVKISSDFKWEDRSSSWLLALDITPGIAVNPWIPQTVSVYLRIEINYPFGDIRIFPAKDSGFTSTFEHQLFNDAGSDDVPYRNGEICASSEQWSMGTTSANFEPYTAEERLYSRVKRLCEWLVRAPNRNLVQQGDWFEIPHFPNTRAGRGHLAFIESPASLEIWAQSAKRIGIVRATKLNSGVQLITEFRNLNGSSVFTPSTGNLLNKSNSYDLGLWLLLSEVPTLEPYEAPSTWGQLYKICSIQNIDAVGLLKSGYPRLVAGTNQHLLLGFPIPERVGGEINRIHWQPIELPNIEKPRRVDGFRDPEVFHWRRARETWLSESSKINWKGSENWSSDQLVLRAPGGDEFENEVILLIGAGALGSAFVDLLARSGIRRGVIFDGEFLEAGNLIRHELTMNEIKQPKASALASQLNIISPFGQFDAINQFFNGESEQDEISSSEATLVIDCTGNIAALNAISKLNLESSKLFVSLSIAPNARYFFFFVSHGKSFPIDRYWQSINPILNSSEVIKDLTELPRETGCWDPRMPVSPEDVTAMASIGVRLLREYLLKSPEHPTLRVFEQQLTNDGAFSGYVEQKYG